MADIELTRTHGLSLTAARAAADRMAESLGRKFGLAGTWKGNTLTFERPGVSGSLALTEKDLHLAVTLGFLLKAMKGSIERAVNEEMDRLFEKPAAEDAARQSPPKAKKPAVPKKKGG